MPSSINATVPKTLTLSTSPRLATYESIKTTFQKINILKQNLNENYVVYFVSNFKYI